MGVVTTLGAPFARNPVVHPVGAQFIILLSFLLYINYVFKEINEV
jgi:hypothetical protein